MRQHLDVGLGGRIFHCQPITRPQPGNKKTVHSPKHITKQRLNRPDLCKLEKGASYPGLEIIAKLSTVLEVEPAELLKVPASKGRRESRR
jgi:hypothetical protein